MTYNSPFVFVNMSRTGKFVLIGAADGKVFFRKIDLLETHLKEWTDGHQLIMDLPASLLAASDQGQSLDDDSTKDDSGLFKQICAHSTLNGKVNTIATTFDDAFICSGGEDGGLFVHRVKFRELGQSNIIEDYFHDEEHAEIEDIHDINAYSIQDAKMKAEKDREMSDADKKKQNMRSFIAELRSEYQKILVENERAESFRQLQKEDMNIDPGLREDVGAFRLSNFNGYFGL